MKLRMKVMEHRGKRFVVSIGIQTVHGHLCVYAMSDDETMNLSMTVEDYNALPYFYFEEVGPAPHNTMPWRPT